MYEICPLNVPASFMTPYGKYRRALEFRVFVETNAVSPKQAEWGDQSNLGTASMGPADPAAAVRGTGLKPWPVLAQTSTWR